MFLLVLHLLTVCFVAPVSPACFGTICINSANRTVEFSADACQQRCQVVEDCAHFTFWPDGGCLLTGDISYPKANLWGERFLFVLLPAVIASICGT